MASNRFKIAVLHNPHEHLPPSSLKTLRFFRRVASKHNVTVELLTVGDQEKIKDFDGLFIRTEPFIGNEAYWIAAEMYKMGLPVDDDPLSIIQSTDKAHMHGVFDKHGISTPETQVISDDCSLDQLIDRFGFPIVIKIPNGSFSKGVYKALNPVTLKELLDVLFKNSKRLVAQRYTPTDFDWRVGVIGGKPLYVCKYYMAPGHWQIIKHLGAGKGYEEGNGETIALVNAPKNVVDLAVKAANLVGNGLYGVDLKQVGDKVMVIEVNDNPNIEHGIEDEADGDSVWLKIIQWFKDNRKVNY